MRILIVGAGVSGATLARSLADAGYAVRVVEAKSHPSGHCHTERDARTGIMKHVFGPHIFHSDDVDVWSFVSRFAEFRPFALEVRASVAGRLFSLPINLNTLNQFFERQFTAEGAQAHIRNLSVPLDHDPRNFEEQAISSIGEALYNAFFKGYTQKQWGRPPDQLPSDIFKRLPLRFTEDNNYFHHSRIGIPQEGYTALVEKMLHHPLITVEYNTKFHRDGVDREFDHIFYTGGLDAFFNFEFGRLPYRSLRFEDFVVAGDFQKSAIVNYPDPEVPYTRISEHKKFSPWETHEKSLCSREFSFECGENDVPFYPVNLAAGSALLDRYRYEATQLRNVSFVGRLATFKYLDMDVAIGQARHAAAVTMGCLTTDLPVPAFFQP
ncbi:MULTISPECIES: UDP-galactopyranose mutase [unclassified Mesorhizobium]|uniref:UDP-galactopyranose/dTDP-fucopyranose mutase family protein n=1 Tax=unclassified Mesorhizobium TaxID=325217 RepID=UPI000FD4D1E6|nr:MULTISPECIES: UDP-galactopyranose mutase [unclassified Mesorhizobium]RVB71879.1 UDP-galactopyranose mutase [Mesorhizobium sp. M6A.T.Cr.TU.014.01.1.1]RWP77275.1 MAG: UDP-galactopyranose mutase [Mesorhizobium sp.]RWP96881.1 MAG: UDP-galactopyranose mutase [Mesorhizobium sp.]RWP97906.1 MAG: UDP-galactopyranose mutase [Mesorhizobium sp.]